MGQTRFFLGVDIGGTKTAALIADEDGHACGYGQAGPGNHQTVGYSGLQKSVSEAVRLALTQAGLSMSRMTAAGLGIAGYDWPSQREAHLQSLTQAGLQMPLEIVNDTIIGLLAGASQGWGVAIVAGTSNNCRGRDRQGREGRVCGDASAFGEYGGATEIMMKVVHAVNYEWTRRGPTTALSPLLLDLTGAASLAGLIEGIATGYYIIKPEWARLVFRVAEAGDAVARQIITWAGRELGELACAVIRQLALEDEAVEVVLAGSVFDGGSLLIEPLRQTVQGVAPQARLVRLEAPPVLGGVLLAREVASLANYTCRLRLVETTRALISSANSSPHSFAQSEIS